MNAFSRSNLGVALLRLLEAESRLGALEARHDGRDVLTPGLLKDESIVRDVRWSVREAKRLIEAATALDDMEQADSVPAPDSNTRRVGG